MSKKTGPPRSEGGKAFAKLLSQGDRSKGVYDMFRDFCDMAYCTTAKIMAPNEERAEALEARYMRVVNTYQKKDDLKIYPEMFDIAMTAIEGGGIDFMGQVASELSMLDARMGQFFTPYEVAKMMAMMTYGQNPPPGHFLTLSEPAAGAGGMILAFADVMRENGGHPEDQMLVHAIDISPLAYHMCYLQLWWANIPAYVQRGDTLRMQFDDGAWTFGAINFFNTHGHLDFKGESRWEKEQRTKTMVDAMRLLLQPAAEIEDAAEEAQTKRQVEALNMLDIKPVIVPAEIPESHPIVPPPEAMIPKPTKADEPMVFKQMKMF